MRVVRLNRNRKPQLGFRFNLKFSRVWAAGIWKERLLHKMGAATAKAGSENIQKQNTGDVKSQINTIGPADLRA